MANFQETVSAAARKYARRWCLRDADDVSQQVWVALLEADEPSTAIVEWIDENVRRIVSREHKRLSRNRDRYLPAIEVDKDEHALSPLDHCIKSEQRSFARKSVADSVENEFDRKTVQILTDQHPRFTSFRQLANARFPGHASSAYRARRSLLNRIGARFEQLMQIDR